MSNKINLEIENCVRNNINWQNLPHTIKQILNNNPKDYDRYIFNYSLKNQLRYRGNLVRKVFRNEQRYYELLIEKSINFLSLFPYHLADIVTKGLRVTPFNYYLDVIANLLKNDKSYDTLPNFTAADCLRVLGIGRNEYLALISELKTNTSKLFRKPNPLHFLPKFPMKINIEPWWKIEVGYVLESDIKYVNDNERGLIDDLIDFGSQTVGKCDYFIIHSLYKRGLIYLDVPINGEDKICIPPLKNFVMNRISGDYFENLLYKVFVTTDEYMTISELASMLQINLDTVKQAVSFFCRLGFAKKKMNDIFDNDTDQLHVSWLNKQTDLDAERPQITPLNYHTILNNENQEATGSSQTNNDSSNDSPQQSNSKHQKIEKDNSIEYISSDGNASEFSFTNMPLSEIQDTSSCKNEKSDLSSENETTPKLANPKGTKLEPLVNKTGKRVGFLFDSTLTAFLMMGNLSPGLKNHAVTMFEVGKLSDEGIDAFLTELEKVSLLDCEGEGEVSRYFNHAIILRSTIIALRNILNGGLDLLRLECLESLDYKTRDRLLEKKYKFIISASPLSGTVSHLFSIPFFGQFYRSSINSHIWTKLFYYHISGYGPPSLLLTKGTILKIFPKIFLGYNKLLVTICHTESYVIGSENFHNINDQLKNNCVLLQGYGIRNPGELRYEAFPFDKNDPAKLKWSQHKAVQKLNENLDLENTCGYLIFCNTGVPDYGCEEYEADVCLRRFGTVNLKKRPGSESQDLCSPSSVEEYKIPVKNDIPVLSPGVDLLSPAESDITTFNRSLKANSLKTPDENHFAVTPEQNHSPSNVFRSTDCNELLAKELANLDDHGHEIERRHIKDLVSPDSIEIPFIPSEDQLKSNIFDIEDDEGEPWTLLDVHFGVPLFDVDCNTRICELLVKKLCLEENLIRLPETNATMNAKFLKFVKQCLYFEDENIELVKIGKLPNPRINLAFKNGKICYWNGK